MGKRVELLLAWAWESREDTIGGYDGEAQGDGSSPGMLRKDSSAVSHLLLEVDMELWQELHLETALENHRASPILQ